MSRRALAAIFAVAALFALPAAAQSQGEAQQSARNIRAHMGFLASDLLAGRDAGSNGYDIAAEYAASQFRQLGLTPAGAHGTYFQPVPLLAFRAIDTGDLRLTSAGGRAKRLKYGVDYLIGRNPRTAETRVSAPLVFVGFGVEAPECNRDDYAGLDVRGKIVVALEGAPKGFQTEERAYYASGRTKRATAARHGAVGYIEMSTPEGEVRRPPADSAPRWSGWAMTWREASGEAFVVAPEVASLGTITVAGAAKLFVGAPTSLETLWTLAAAPAGDLPRFPLPSALSAVLHVETTPVESRNVAALLEGSDPKLRAETVVLSAHLDHLGVLTAGPGDRINNGALDNAAGVATTLEVARIAAEAGMRPKRSILFLLVTAEEKGLVGSEYFARNPTVPLGDIVADVNLDMPVITYDFTDVVAFGAERSTIGAAVRRAAARMNVALSADPLPEEGLFTRSDHFRFVEQGVPSVFLMTGFANGGEAQFRDFLAKRYHKPGDDLSQAIDYAAGAKFARLNYEITRELTDMPARPDWKPGDFFGGKFSRLRPYRQP